MRHGKISTYTKGCRCAKCAAAWRDYQRAYMYEYSHGIKRWVSVRPALTHIAYLRSRGMTSGTISEHAGLTPQYVRRLECGHFKHMKRRYREAILGVPADAVGRHALVPSTVARRILDTLREAGIKWVQLTAITHIAKPWLIYSQERVMSKTHHKLCFTYEVLARQGTVSPALLKEL